MERLNCPDHTYAFKNCILLNIPLHLEHSTSFDSKKKYYTKVGRYYYYTEHFSDLTKNQIMMNLYQRRDTSIDDTKNIVVMEYQKLISNIKSSSSIIIKVSLPNAKEKTMVTLEKGAMTNIFKDFLIDSKLILTHEQKILFKTLDGLSLVLHINDYSGKHFIIDECTNISLCEGDENIVIAENKPILKSSLNLVELGIGGLDKEFSEMFRRAFSTRMLKPETIKKMDIKHIKGILLHGPPGCGKTLIARKICQMIDSVEPKIVNGPDLLNKYVGESEANMRRLFTDAENEYKKKGDNSRLHVIVFDEIDSICKVRGSTGGGTGVNDSIVNQLLTKFDGVEQYNNILIIGMTNRPDMLDDALLRPGRFELQLQISLPDLIGRQQILTIHTTKLYDTQRIDKNVDLNNVASITKNYTGAEIEGLVNSARSYAIQRATEYDKETSMININEDKIIVSKEDFDNAIKEIKPKFGLDVSVKDHVSKYGIIMYSKPFTNFYDQMQNDIRSFMSSINNQMICFISGKNGSGRTSLALDMALKTNYPFIKYINGRSIIGMSESQKSQHIKSCFDDADKSPQSVIVIDDVENIIDWVYADITGVPRFSLSVCSTIRSLINYHHKNKRLIIFNFDDESLTYISRVKILPKSDRTYVIPDVEIDVETQNHINSINNNTEKSMTNNVQKYCNIVQHLPIKQYIFEFNNTICSN
jgi:vesicle-fusing ATPase